MRVPDLNIDTLYMYELKKMLLQNLSILVLCNKIQNFMQPMHVSQSYLLTTVHGYLYCMSNIIILDDISNSGVISRENNLYYEFVVKR